MVAHLKEYSNGVTPRLVEAAVGAGGGMTAEELEMTEVKVLLMDDFLRAASPVYWK